MMDTINTAELAPLAAVLIALGVLLYQSPTRAWKLLVASLEQRVSNLEKHLITKDETIRELEGHLRRHRTIRSVLEALLRDHGILVPRFNDGEHPAEFPVERRTPVVTVDATTIHVESAEQP